MRSIRRTMRHRFAWPTSLPDILHGHVAAENDVRTMSFFLSEISEHEEKANLTNCRLETSRTLTITQNVGHYLRNRMLPSRASLVLLVHQQVSAVPLIGQSLLKA